MNAPHDNPAGQGEAEILRPRLEPDSSFAEWMPRRADEGRAIDAKPSFGSAGQRLIPRRPPGRCSRKARTFSAEIKRLRAEGYSFGAIREALAEAGVVVSTSTVQREAARGTSPSESAPVSDTPP